MSTVEHAIRLIEQEVAVKKARCAIADEGFPPESTLLGTRDGYLNLALELLRFVAETDRGSCWDAEQGSAWDDCVKAALYQLPTQSAWLVGAYLFKSHADFITGLSRLVNPQIEHPLANDPQFHDPASAPVQQRQIGRTNADL